MELTFLGKGAAFYPAYGNTAAYFCEGKVLYLIDCGETVFEKLIQKGILAEVEVVYVLVTHLHADHVGSLASLISYLFYKKKIRAAVIHPEPTIVQLLTLEGIDSDIYRYHPVMPDNPAGIEARPVPVKHVHNMNCYGYLIRDRAECIYYSGDASDIPPEVLSDFLSGVISRLYQDTAVEDSGHPTHCSYQRMEQLIPPAMRRNVFCMHLDGACEGILAESGFQVVKAEGEL